MYFNAILVTDISLPQISVIAKILTEYFLTICTFLLTIRTFIDKNRKIMQFAPTITTLEKVVFYAAPIDPLPLPYTIPSGIQLVELITDGVVYFEQDNIQYTCRRGTVFWHIAGDQTIWRTTVDAPYRCMVFQFRTDSPERIAPRLSCWQDSENSLEEFLNTVHSNFSGKSPTSQKSALLASYCISELMMHALQLKNRSPYAPPGLDGSDEEKLLTLAIEQIRKALPAMRNVQAMYRAVKIPRNKLFALFRDKLHTTPFQWLREQQLQYSRSLLESSDLPLKDIAGKCGFDHVEVFHRCFVKRFGEPPGSYRNTRFAYRDFSN